MFRSTKKLGDPPKCMTMQEIQEDLETFAKPYHILNKAIIVDDLKAKDEELSLTQWWDAYQVYEQQIIEMKEVKERLIVMKEEMSQQNDECLQRKINLENEINDNLKRIEAMLSPKS